MYRSVLVRPIVPSVVLGPRRPERLGVPRPSQAPWAAPKKSMESRVW